MSKGDTERALTVIRDRKKYRRDAAAVYAQLLRAHFNEDSDVEWAVINTAILERWSESGLSTIKDWAWKIYEGPGS